MAKQLELFSEYLGSVFLSGDKPTPNVKPENQPLNKKIETSLRLLRAAAAKSENPIEISYSGGKDSDVILELAKMAGIPFRAIYKNTTIDPPGTIKHCKDNGVEIVSRKSFAQVIQAKGFPTYLRRFCCHELKEYKILDRAVHGIRLEESTKRRKLYKEPSFCRLYNKKERVEVFLPILYWTEKDIEHFIMQRGITCHPLYYDDNGRFCVNRRLGCMGCPQKYDKGLADFKKRPRLVKFWLRNGIIWWNSHKLDKTKRKFKSPYELFVRNVFFDDYESFRNSIDNMFGKIDCKDFLENYFGIEL